MLQIVHIWQHTRYTRTSFSNRALNQQRVDQASSTMAFTLDNPAKQTTWIARASRSHNLLTTHQALRQCAPWAHMWEREHCHAVGRQSGAFSIPEHEAIYLYQNIKPLGTTSMALPLELKHPAALGQRHRKRDTPSRDQFALHRELDIGTGNHSLLPHEPGDTKYARLIHFPGFRV
jgi:hypothetical protein